MFDALAGALAFFYDLWPSYGGAIILLTLAIMLVLSPLSIKSTRSMLAMARLQPEIKKLQQKHKDDRQKLNEEMLAFYQQNKINPFSSCLPLLLQMPIFFVLYRVINGLNKIDAGNGGGPSYLSQSSQLWQDLKATIPTGVPDAIEMDWLGMDLSHSLTGELGTNGLVAALPFFVLVALVAGSGYVQQRQVTARNTGSTVNPQQQMIMRLMPAFMAVISISIPAGLVLYFVVSNLVRIGQQALVTRMEGGALTPATADAIAAPSTPKRDRTGGNRPAPSKPNGRQPAAGGGDGAQPEAKAARRPGARGAAPTPSAGQPRPSPASPSAGPARNKKKRRK
jgi:YidC/Oxa1 family membrane protein insertase